MITSTTSPYIQPTLNAWKCTECDWMGFESELLTAPNPFEPDYAITGCPRCHDIGNFVQTCDECDKEATCGTPTLAGIYRRTCGEHKPREASEK